MFFSGSHLLISACQVTGFTHMAFLITAMQMTHRLMPLPSGWSVCLHHLTSAAHPECSSPAGLQPVRVHPIYTASQHHALATRGWLNPFQVTGTGLPCCHWPSLHLALGQIITLRSAMAKRPATASLQGDPLTLNKILIVSFPSSGWNPKHLLSQTKNSSVQNASWPT